MPIEKLRPTVDSSDVYDDDDRVNMASVVSSALIEQLRASGTPFEMVATCTDGAYGIVRADKAWHIEKHVAEDLALGRLNLADMFAKSIQMKNPCKPDASLSAGLLKKPAK